MTTRMKSSKRRAEEKRKRRNMAILMVIIIVVGGFSIWKYCFAPINIDGISYPRYIKQAFIEEDGRSRTGYEIRRPKNIVIHYVSNPKSTAKANRDYFNSSESNVSSHFIVGLKGEVIQCVPLDEQSSASNNRNVDTISIEVCHPDSSGKFNDKTYSALVELTAWLCGELRMNQRDLIRHYDITGKLCPKYFVENPDAWEEFKNDVKEEL